jgi:hypothetical protein
MKSIDPHLYDYEALAPMANHLFPGLNIYTAVDIWHECNEQ